MATSAAYKDSTMPQSGPTHRTQDMDSSVHFANGGSVDNLDSYIQGIELSNACRKFYVCRMQAAEGIKVHLLSDLASSGHKKLDKSMVTLRKEVVSLIDQDLALMRQLLTLNERIEELKWQRKMGGYSPVSMTTSTSSGDILEDSDCNNLSESELDRHPAERDRLFVPQEYEMYNKYMSPSNLSLFRECTYNSTQDNLHEVFMGDVNKGMRNSHLKHSTSDLGSSDEIVSSATDTTRMSNADSFLSVDFSSNSNSLKRSEDMDLQSDMNISSKFVSNSVPKIDVSVHIDDSHGNGDDKTCLGPDIQITDHEYEMII